MTQGSALPDGPLRNPVDVILAERVSSPATHVPSQIVAVEHVSPFTAARRRFFRHRLALIGLIIVTVIVLMSIFAPLLSPWNPNFVDLSRGSRMPPNAAHILGTDVSARDIWA